MSTLDLLTLSGDEDGGVAIGCRECCDGGDFFGYLGWNPPAGEDVRITDSAADLWAVGLAHLVTKHRFQLRG